MGNNWVHMRRYGERSVMHLAAARWQWGSSKLRIGCRGQPTATTSCSAQAIDAFSAYITIYTSAGLIVLFKGDRNITGTKRRYAVFVSTSVSHAGHVQPANWKWASSSITGLFALISGYIYSTSMLCLHMQLLVRLNEYTLGCITVKSCKQAPNAKVVDSNIWYILGTWYFC